MLRYARQEQLGFDIGFGLDESDAINENAVGVGERLPLTNAVSSENRCGFVHFERKLICNSGTASQLD